jgi:hypothetical protein
MLPKVICQHHQFLAIGSSAHLHCRTMCLGQAPVIEKHFFADGTFEAMTR